MVSIPCASHAAIFAPSDECFATAMMFKTVFDLRVGMLTRRHCDKAKAFAQGSVATKQSIYPRAEKWIASLRPHWRGR
jgi:hypothetical protein